jgi:hypothetical protein
VFEMDSGKSTRLQIWVIFRSSGFQSLLGKWGMCKFWFCNLMNFAAEGVCLCPETK